MTRVSHNALHKGAAHCVTSEIKCGKTASERSQTVKVSKRSALINVYKKGVASCIFISGKTV